MFPLVARRLLESLANPELSFRESRLHYLVVNGRWHLRMRFGRALPWTRPERATLILLSYKRLHNMQALVDCARKIPFFDRIIVANNNVDVDIRDWVRTRDPRVTLRNQPGGGPSGTRYEIALHADGEYCVSVDDVFLFPEEYQTLLEGLLAEPQVPHGICGQIYFPEAGPDARLCFALASSYRGQSPSATTCTRSRRRTPGTSSGLLDEFGYKDTREAGRIDDIVLSDSGEARPICRLVDALARRRLRREGQCVPSGRLSVAAHRRPPATGGPHAAGREALHLVGGPEVADGHAGIGGPLAGRSIRPRPGG